MITDMHCHFVPDEFLQFMQKRDEFAVKVERTEERPGGAANVALNVKSLELIVFRQAPLELRLFGERLPVYVGDERLHRAILRRFGLIHVRDRRCEHRPNRIS